MFEKTKIIEKGREWPSFFKKTMVGNKGLLFDVASHVTSSVTRKKLPNVYKSCPKIISLEKWLILTPSQKLPKNVGDLGKLIVAKGLEIFPKVQ